MNDIVLTKLSHDFLKKYIKSIKGSDALKFLDDERGMLEDLLNDLNDYIMDHSTLKPNEILTLEILFIVKCLQNIIEKEKLSELYHHLGFIEDIIDGLKEEMKNKKHV